MAARWLFLEIVIIVFYKNLTQIKNEESQQNVSVVINEDTRLLGSEANEETSRERTGSYESFKSINKEIQDLDDSRVEIDSSTITATNKKQSRINIVDNSQTGPLIVRMYNEYIKEEVVAVLSITFTAFFMQLSLEVIRQLIKTI